MSTTAGIMPLARQLGNKLGGEPWIKPIERLEPIAGPRAPTFNAWPNGDEMRRIWNGEQE